MELFEHARIIVVQELTTIVDIIIVGWRWYSIYDARISTTFWKYHQIKISCLNFFSKVPSCGTLKKLLMTQVIWRNTIYFSKKLVLNSFLHLRAICLTQILLSYIIYQWACPQYRTLCGLWSQSCPVSMSSQSQSAHGQGTRAPPLPLLIDWLHIWND